MSLKKTLSDFVDEVRSQVPEIDVDELKEEQDGVLLIDVREPDERARGYIPDSLGIPRGVLERDVEKRAFGGRVSDDDLSRRIVVYCGGGSRSMLAAHTLREMGFSDVASLRGGFGAWGEAGHAVDHDRAT